MITQDLGIATAYGYAKSKGYTGTEAEFAELMASYASTAQTAIEAADRAVEANTAAQSAKISAQSSASTASTAAQTATSKASEAMTAAGTAMTKASEASASADTASTAAQTATDKASEATTAATTATTKASEAAASATTATAAKTDAETARDAAAQSASEAAASAESIDPDEFNRKIYAAFATDTATGVIASLPDGADSIPMKDVLVHIEPVQAGSGDPSPDNVRPITGWTGAKVMRTGKNLIDGSVMYKQGADIFIGTSTYRGESVYLKPGTYTFSVYYKRAIRKNLYARDVETMSHINGFPKYYAENVQPATVTFTLTKPTHVSFSLYSTEFESTDDITSVQLELGSTATDYEPYSGQTYDIEFPSEAGTVYGGTLDVTSGVLTVDRAMADLGTLDWTYVQNYTYFSSITLSSAIARPVSAQTPIAGLLCSIYKIASAQDTGSGNVNKTIAVDTYGYLRFKDLAYTDVNTWKEAVGSQTIVYPLATPITYQLTPQEITSLLGTNNLWADTGDSEVEYRADTKLYITKKITDAVNALS